MNTGALCALITLLLTLRGTVCVDATELAILQTRHGPGLQSDDEPHRTLLDTLGQVIRWRTSHPALQWGSMKLLPPHPQLLRFVREYRGTRMLCVFNFSDRYVRERLPPGSTTACLIAGSGLSGGRVVDRTIDCNPWGGLVALLAP